ncbi:hypothetical protein F5Y17DRAFT_282723 [Xylariaceae sp. FL0594]|nr:hypothetical protein F5Y17DRAFT_282723 [Xylariaceae sp. FL0594]
MATKPTTPLRKLWYQWKSLRLPWRKRFLVGLDLQGNTYWEFRQARGDGPQPTFRRIVHYPRSTHLSEVKVPPDWHQWLRYQRANPPTLQEQSAEAMRQERIKLLAAEADARWEAKPSLLDMPPAGTPKKGIAKPPVEEMGKDKSEIPTQKRVEEERKEGQDPTKTTTTNAPSKAEDPWKKAQRGAPGETWQPEAWNPTASKKR